MRTQTTSCRALTSAQCIAPLRPSRPFSFDTGTSRTEAVRLSEESASRTSRRTSMWRSYLATFRQAEFSSFGWLLPVGLFESQKKNRSRRLRRQMVSASPDLCAVHRALEPSRLFSNRAERSCKRQRLDKEYGGTNDANVPSVIENPPASHLWAMPCMHQQRPNAKGRLRGALSLSVSVVYG